MSDTLPTGEQLARVFHETYERMAPYYGYETRIGTREFDPLTINGKLMIATCEEVLRPFVSALSDATKWVSVEERVPTDDSSVIVHLHGGARTVGVWSGHDWYNQKGRAFVSLGANVTHWMPIPEAPK